MGVGDAATLSIRLAGQAVIRSLDNLRVLNRNWVGEFKYVEAIIPHVQLLIN